MFVTITTRTERVRVLPLFSLCLFICVRLIINRLNLIVLNFYFSFIGKKKSKNTKSIINILKKSIT